MSPISKLKLIAMDDAHIDRMLDAAHVQVEANEKRDALLAKLAEEEYRRLLAAPTALDMREAIEWMGDAEAKVLAAAWSGGTDADVLRCARLGFALLPILQSMFRKAAEEAAIGRLDRMDAEAAPIDFL